MAETDRIELMPAPVAPADWQKMLRIGFAVIFLTFFVFGGWTAVARLDAAVVAMGTISVESYRKTIQHLEGGIVREILVRDGDTVQEGDVLVRLDPTRSEATDKTYRQQLALALALEARLIAQRDMRDQVTFPADVLVLKDDPLIAVSIRDNQRQFETRREGLVRAIDVLEKQIGQVQKEIEQATVDQKSAQGQLESIEQELPNLKALLEKGLVALPRVTTLERQQIQTKGVLENAKLAFAKGHEKIAELNARIAQLRQDYRQEAANALLDIRKTLGDASQQVVIAGDALRRVEIKAPVSGTVQQMRVFTVGGVIRPGDPIMDLVPSSDTLVVRAKVGPFDIDRVHNGLHVEVRVPQFMRWQLQPIEGSVRSVSRDALTDEVSRQPYFAVEVAVDRTSIPKEIDEKLTPGMTVDTVIRTEERTVLQYLIGPMFNRLATGMRER
jgi:HlyD family type I secretion membrane fusion protein